MEGRYPNGILFCITNCNDPSKEEEFNYWYNHMHVPDTTSVGVFQHGIRYVNTNPKAEEGKYAATYEINWDDVARAWAVYRYNSDRRDPSRRSPLLELVLGRNVFKKRGGEYCSVRKPMRGILAVLLNCKDPAREEEFNNWYTDVHIPDILDSGLYHSAYWYESLDPTGTGGAKYLALYETDHHDPGQAGEELTKLRTDWERRGRLFDAAEVVLRLTARRFWPMD